eukprot:627765-Rhodomonas_salina.1
MAQLLFVVLGVLLKEPYVARIVSVSVRVRRAVRGSSAAELEVVSIIHTAIVAVTKAPGWPGSSTRPRSARVRGLLYWEVRWHQMFQGSLLQQGQTAD